jgi:hypothetical protein
MLAWAQSVTWKGIKPIFHLSQQVYHKGISLTKKAREEIELRLLLPSTLTKMGYSHSTLLAGNFFLRNHLSIFRHSTPLKTEVFKRF